MKKVLVLTATVLLVLFALVGCGISAPALDYPNRQITFVCPYAPGGGVDGIVRMTAAYLSEKFGVQILVENIPGAGSIIGWNTVQQRPSDGYTLTTATGTANPWAISAADPTALAWDPDAFTVLCRFSGYPATHGLIVRNEERWPTFVEFVEDLKASPPGTYNIGIMGPNQLTDPVVMDFERVFGVKFNRIYFGNSSEIQTDVLTGDCDVGLIGCNRANFVNNENFRVICLFGDYVDPNYPVQAGPLISDFQEALGWKWSDQKYFNLQQGGDYIMIKSDTPQEIKDFLVQAFKELCDDEKYKEAMLAVSFVSYLGPDEARANLAESEAAMQDYMAVTAGK